MAQKNKNGISDIPKSYLREGTTIVALITVFLYLFPMAIKMGNYSYFGIPFHYLSFDLNIILHYLSINVAAIVIVLIIAIYVAIVIPLSKIEFQKYKEWFKDLKNRIILISLIIFLILGIVLLYIYYTSDQLILTVGFVVAFALYILLNNLKGRLHKLITWIMLVLVIISLASFTLVKIGANYAESVEHLAGFKVDGKEYVIIDIYNKSYYILKEINNDRIVDSFELIEIKEVKDITEVEVRG